MREIVLDTETTGFNPAEGDRIVEIGCVEIMGQMPTGNVFHKYIDPERSMPEEAFKIHGLSDEFLRDKPKFTDVAEEFLEFIGDARLVIHNAAFDMKFLNFELQRAKFKPLPMDAVVDTLLIARQKYPGSPVSLDALCRRYKIDNSSRTLHGALLDSEILAEVYLELTGGRQPGLVLAPQKRKAAERSQGEWKVPHRARPLKSLLSDEEIAAHDQFVKSLGDNLWHK